MSAKKRFFMRFLMNPFPEKLTVIRRMSVTRRRMMTVIRRMSAIERLYCIFNILKFVAHFLFVCVCACLTTFSKNQF